MSFHSVRLNFNIVLLVLLGIYNRVDFIVAHQCYSCGPKANISCDKFDPSNKSFIKDCPFAKGCSMETHVDLVERSCGEDIGFRDCKTANNVQYCYCSKSLCNGKTMVFSDDEDWAEEGSGTTAMPNTTQNEQKKSSIASQSSQVQVHLYSAFIPVLVILYN